MSEPVIHLSANSDAGPVQGELLGSDNFASIQFFDGAQLSGSPAAISFSFLDGIAPKAFTGTALTELGELRCISQNCISDVSLIQSDLSDSTFDSGLLVGNPAPGMEHSMNENIEFEALNAELLCNLPQVQQALNGDLDVPQLNQLISELQSQLLELNSVSQELLGDFSAELNQAVLQAETADNGSLINSLEAYAGLFAEPDLGGVASQGSAFEATLDGLFTAPEAFPLTLDFSNSNGIQEASELFAATSGNHSISSSATDVEYGEGLAGNSSAGADFS